jgi:hypothetical protein
MKGICLTNCCTVCNLYTGCDYRNRKGTGGNSLCCSKCQKFFACEVYLRQKASTVVRLFQKWSNDRSVREP